MKRFRTFGDALNYIREFTDYERMYNISYNRQNYNLERMSLLLEKIGNPHEKIKTIHIAGTKGKGSTTIMTEAILRRAGYKTGLFISPHLISMLERIQINGANVSERDFVSVMNQLKPHLDKLRPTFFEIMTAAAFLLFAREKVDYAVIEVGLGGRLDSTNIITPIASAITAIGLDHTDKLGNTIRKIASEKAGIIKPSVPVITSAQKREALEVIKRVAYAKNAKLHIVDGNSAKNIRIPLLGKHQIENASVAIALSRYVGNVSSKHIKDALKNVKVPGRIEIIQKNPYIIVDSAHNPISIKATIDSLSALTFNKLIVIFGASLDKDISGMLKIISPKAHKMIFTTFKSPRAAKLSKLDVKSAIRLARKYATPDDLILVTGSFYLAGEVLSILK